MVFILILSLFLVVLAVLFSQVKSLILSLILLEFLSFICLGGCSLVIHSLLSSAFIIVLFGLFVLESVLGLIILINLVNISGSDYVKVVVSLCAYY